MDSYRNPPVSAVVLTHGGDCSSPRFIFTCAIAGRSSPDAISVRTNAYAGAHRRLNPSW